MLRDVQPKRVRAVFSPPLRNLVKIRRAPSQLLARFAAFCWGLVGKSAFRELFATPRRWSSGRDRAFPAPTVAKNFTTQRMGVAIAIFASVWLPSVGSFSGKRALRERCATPRRWSSKRGRAYLALSVARYFVSRQMGGVANFSRGQFFRLSSSGPYAEDGVSGAVLLFYPYFEL